MTVSTPAKIGIGVLAVVGAYLLGYVPATSTARNERAEQVRLTHKLELAMLQVQLGMMSLEANRDNYGVAAQLATPFFDTVRSLTADPGRADEDVKQALQVMLGRRDELTSDLARADPAVKAKIAALYAELYRLTHIR